MPRMGFVTVARATTLMHPYAWFASSALVIAWVAYVVCRAAAMKSRSWALSVALATFVLISSVFFALTRMLG